MDNVLYVTLLGGFSLAWQDRNGPRVTADQDPANQQMWSFLEYLCVHHKKEVPEADLVQAVWGDIRMIDSAGPLKSLLQRARGILEQLGFPNGASVLLNRRGAYFWVPGLEFQLDTDEMERLSAELTINPEQALPAVLDFLNHSGGEFLPGAGKRSWASAMRSHYRSRYLRLLRGAAEILGDREQYDAAIDLCKRAVDIDPFDRQCQLLLIQYLHASGLTRSAVWHYKKIARLYQEQLGTTPPEEIVAFYRRLSEFSHAEQPDIGAIQEKLEQADTLARPLYCDSKAFQAIYHLMARSIPRTGLTAQLAILTISRQDGSVLPTAECEKAMEALRLNGLSGLREGDVCTQYSPNQYMLLLPSANREDAMMTLTRCLSAFEETPIGQNIFAGIAVTPLRAIEA